MRDARRVERQFECMMMKMVLNSWKEFANGSKLLLTNSVEYHPTAPNPFRETKKAERMNHTVKAASKRLSINLAQRKAFGGCALKLSAILRTAWIVIRVLGRWKHC